MTEDQFTKETVLPASDPRSPYHVNLPAYDSKPVDDLVGYFKLWKHFIKSLVFYLKETCLSKEFDANLNYQLINLVQFPGFRDLPNRFLTALDASAVSPPNKPLKKSNSNTSISTQALASTTNGTQSTPATTPPLEKRPNLFKTKSNNSFLKHANPLQPPANASHKRNVSFTNLKGLQSGLLTPRSNSSHHNDIKVPSHYFPEDSMFNNLPPLLVNHHASLHQAQQRLYRDINNKLVPRLESTLKNLSLKIKEIKSSLRNDSFANTAILKEVSNTGKVLSLYMALVELYLGARPVLKKNFSENDEETGATDDPFLRKLQVDYQLKRQLLQENYMYASYVNLQNISKELLVYVVKELTLSLDKFARLVNSELVYTLGDETVNLLLSMRKNVTSDATKDWEYFVIHNRSFLNIYRDAPSNRKREARSFASIQLPYSHMAHNKCIRFGMMYKKQKIIKSYASHYYVLTCNYLHEFKFENDGQTKKREKDKIGGFIGHDDVPVKSYNLNDLAIREKDYRTYKFTLVVPSDPLKKYNLRCRNADEYHSWFGDLQELLKFEGDHLARYEMVARKTGSSQKSSDPETAFLGVFTPLVRTPKGLVPAAEEQNPFDSTFIGDMKLAIPLTSPVMSPTSEKASASDESSSPNHLESSLASTTANPSHMSQHEVYLEAQRQLLQQQRSVLGLKTREPTDQRRDPGFKLQPGSPPDSGLNSRASSSESLSLMINQSNIKSILQSNQELINRDYSQEKKEDLNTDVVSPGSSEIPTVFVSSNH